jgi:hypothetical protein
MTISQIADIHYRTPGSISYKLKSLGIIPHNTHSRGYLEYKNSNLYKEIVETSDAEKKARKEAKLKVTKDDLPLSTSLAGIVETGKSNNAEKKAKKEAKLKARKDDLPLSTTLTQIVEIRNEITELKKDVKEILRLINILYDFETQ